MYRKNNWFQRDISKLRCNRIHQKIITLTENTELNFPLCLCASVRAILYLQRRGVAGKDGCRHCENVRSRKQC